MLKRKAEKSEEDKNTLQQDMTSAITLAQDAKIAKENEIRELQVRPNLFERVIKDILGQKSKAGGGKCEANSRGFSTQTGSPRKPCSSRTSFA